MKLARLVADRGPYLLIGGNGKARLCKAVPLKADLVLVMNIRGAMHNFDRIAKDRTTFTMRDVVTVSTVSWGQVDRFIRERLISPTGADESTRERLFDYQATFLAGILGSLKRAGQRMATLKCVAQLLANEPAATLN